MLNFESMMYRNMFHPDEGVQIASLTRTVCFFFILLISSLRVIASFRRAHILRSQYKTEGQKLIKSVCFPIFEHFVLSYRIDCIYSSIYLFSHLNVTQLSLR